jgi:SMC interacting uncharacterized protein involved in chromosome segregation
LHEQWQKAQTVMQEMQEKLVEGITAQIKQQNESLAQLGARIDELQHIQKEMQTQLQKQQARFQSDLATLHQQMQEKFEQWAQSIEQVQLQGETREAVPEMSVPTRRRTSTRKVAEADPPA